MKSLLTFGFVIAFILTPFYAPIFADSKKDKKDAAAAKVVAPTFSSFKEAYKAGNEALALKKNDEAIAAYEVALTLGNTTQGKSQAANALGWALLRARKMTDAKAAFQKAVDADPKNKVALSNLGYASFQLYKSGAAGIEELKAAGASVDAASAIDSSYKADLVKEVKDALQREEEMTTAEALTEFKGSTFKEAIAYGDDAQAKGHFDAAIKVFATAEAKANSPKAKGAAANRQGKAYLDSRRVKDAVPHFERAIKYQPEEKIFYNNLGMTHWSLYDSGIGDLSNLKKATEIFAKVNSLDPSYRSENFEMAKEELREVDPATAATYEKVADENKAE